MKYRGEDLPVSSVNSVPRFLSSHPESFLQAMNSLSWIPSIAIFGSDAEDLSDILNSRVSRSTTVAHFYNLSATLHDQDSTEFSMVLIDSLSEARRFVLRLSNAGFRFWDSLPLTIGDPAAVRQSSITHLELLDCEDPTSTAILGRCRGLEVLTISSVHGSDDQDCSQLPETLDLPHLRRLTIVDLPKTTRLLELILSSCTEYLRSLSTMIMAPIIYETFKNSGSSKHVIHLKLQTFDWDYTSYAPRCLHRADKRALDRESVIGLLQVCPMLAHLDLWTIHSGDVPTILDAVQYPLVSLALHGKECGGETDIGVVRKMLKTGHPATARVKILALRGVPADGMKNLEMKALCTKRRIKLKPYQSLLLILSGTSRFGGLFGRGEVYP